MEETANDTDYSSAEFKDALEDVHTRFLLNLPESELSTADRILFQIEQAWWFYEDLLCDPHPELNLPRFKDFKKFASIIFAYSPLLETKKFEIMWNEFTLYKRKISGYGCILLSSDYTRIILCQVWGGKSYMLPAGKINQGEEGADAAARETYEETGFDPLCKEGLTAQWKASDPSKITWRTTLSDDDLLVHTADNGKRRNCYIVAGVPEDFPFEPVARKEVQNIDWYPIDQVPKPNFAVLPFIGKLKSWIKKERKSERSRSNAKARKRTPKKSAQSRSRGNTPNKSTPRRRPVEPTGILSNSNGTAIPGVATCTFSSSLVDSLEKNRDFIEKWVRDLPKPKPTVCFGTFRLDADEIWRKATDSIESS